jgi:MYXO-CTERM domain-containing protein
MRNSIWFLPSSATAGAAFVAASFIALSASAHIELIEPAPRYTLPANKSCPCGDGDSNRRCQQTAEESHDPLRSTNVTTFEAGSTIRVVADEYIDHAGRMRVAFDPSGADLADFNDNVLMDVADPSERGLSMATPRVWEFDVQLPDMTCEDCTLQVIQVMQGGTENPVMDPAPLSTYYTCADIRLVAPGGSTDGEEAALEDEGGATEDAGCSLGAAHTPGGASWGLVPLAGLVALGLRRRRAR